MNVPRVIHHVPVPKSGYSTLCLMIAWAKALEVVGHEDFLRIANLRCTSCLKLCGTAEANEGGKP